MLASRRLVIQGIQPPSGARVALAGVALHNFSVGPVQLHCCVSTAAAADGKVLLLLGAGACCALLCCAVLCLLDVELCPSAIPSASASPSPSSPSPVSGLSPLLQFRGRLAATTTPAFASQDPRYPLPVEQALELERELSTVGALPPKSESAATLCSSKKPVIHLEASQVPTSTTTTTTTVGKGTDSPRTPRSHPHPHPSPSSLTLFSPVAHLGRSGQDSAKACNGSRSVVAEVASARRR
jgi:hypothetical protein